MLSVVSEVRVPRLREERNIGNKVVFILEKAHLELTPHRLGFTLLNSADHHGLIQESGRHPADFRPDILHQCLLSLQDSPLNRSGRLIVYIRTANNDVIEVHPQADIPRGYIHFTHMMVSLLLKRRVGATTANLSLLQMVKGDFDALLPAGCRRVGLSVSGEDVQSLAKYMGDLVKEQEESKKPVVIVVGAVAKSDPTNKDECDLVEDTIRISRYGLSAAQAIAKVLNEFEHLYKVCS
ncbi:MAG: hypothetical protein KVP17_003018 [Porospora cf. gigantea B]|uniref:uncharacterized protein n=1 Tax=Porospora cf. gigantea B TaxID=2853592 RepID=UPI003571BBC6|nr:MAG: hypothetical protein KVP17_003018 [Porospora cf. gigantea B]